MNIAFTGPRRLTETEAEFIRRQLEELQNPEDCWHVGDAPGADAAVREMQHRRLEIYRVTGRAAWAFAKRSKQMVDAIAPAGKLYAYPNKPCPSKCTPRNAFSGHGSGTWGTIAYATQQGLDVEIFPLVEDLELPSWTERAEQLSLF